MKTQQNPDKRHILILDDDELRHRKFTEIYTPFFPKTVLMRAYTVAEAKAHLDDYVFDVAFLDHDLADFNVQAEGTGLDVARYIVAMDEDRRPKEVWIHSWNEDRAKVMEAELRAAGVRCRRKPFKA